MNKEQLVNAICNVMNDIGDRIDGDDDRSESEFLHDIWYWLEDLVARSEEE